MKTMKTCKMGCGKMKAGGTVKKMAKGGVQKIVGMPGYNATLYPTSFKEGGATKAKKFAALAPPYDKPTAADRIAGAKMQKGGMYGNTTPGQIAPGRMKKGGMIRSKKK